MTAKIRRMRRRIPKRNITSVTNGAERLRKMFMREWESLRHEPEVLSRTPTDLLIGIKFSDDHFHGVYPDEDEREWLLNELIEDNPDIVGEYEVEEVEGSSSLCPSLGRELPKRIIFHNRQAIGDILMFTCGVRDFKKAWPEVEVKVESTAMHIWDHNPNISKEEFVEVIDPARELKKGGDENFTSQNQRPFVEKAIREGRPVKLYIGPGKGTNQSNYSGLHFANAYRQSIEDTLGVDIPQGPIKPDVYMSREEIDKGRIFDFPYWLITAGEKGDWTAKTWPVMWWQDIVDAMPNINFVQIGQKGRGHRPLEGKNVVNYLGMTEDRHTGIRDLFNLFYHCEGSIGMVSFHMHLAAAFNKPCVVIAGAREPQSFTHYNGHRYLSTDGSLPCTVNANGKNMRVCWFCDVNRCEAIVEVLKQKVPKCMHMVEPGDVVRAVNQYYSGGRLGGQIKETGNKKVVPPLLTERASSIDAEIGNGPSESAPSSKEKGSVDELVENWGYTWGGTSITREDWIFMCGVLTRYHVKTVLEFGCGLSTLLMSDYDMKRITVTSYEADNYESWSAHVKESNPALDIRKWDGESDIEVDSEIINPPIPRPSKKFGLVFVDGPSGSKRREHSIRIAAKKADLVIVHDAGRPLEREYQEKYLSPHFELMDKGGTRCWFWKRRADKSLFDEAGIRGAAAGKALREKMISLVAPSAGLVRMIFNGRGEGGAERSTTWIMNRFVELGYDVEYVFPNGPSGTFKKSGSKDVKLAEASAKSICAPCDFLILYANDWVWDFKISEVTEMFSSVRANRRVMVINYRMGEIGRLPWTVSWNKYLFLNSGLEAELKIRLGMRAFDTKMKSLAPPIDLSEFFALNPKYRGLTRILRHSSQGDVKYPKNFEQRCMEILREVKSATISLMPKPTFMPENMVRVDYRKRNDPPIPQFLESGNVFWYWLPDGYQDQGPKVIMEAQAAGLPVVAQNHSGPRDRVRHEENGFLSNDFSEHLVFLKRLEEPSLREYMGGLAREHARREYDPERWIEEIISD